MTVDDLSRLGYTTTYAYAAGSDDIYRVDGYGISTYVNASDTETLDLLGAMPAHVERVFQADAPEAAEARTRLEDAGYTVDRPDPDQNIFEVTNAGTTIASGVIPDQMPAVADDAIGG